MRGFRVFSVEQTDSLLRGSDRRKSERSAFQIINSVLTEYRIQMDLE